MMFKRIILTFFLTSIAIVPAQIPNDTMKSLPPKPLPAQVQVSGEIGTFWQIFSSGGALGVAFIFIIYLYLDNRDLKKKYTQIQTKLFEVLEKKESESEKEFLEVMKKMINNIETHDIFIEKLLKTFIRNSRKDKEAQ